MKGMPRDVKERERKNYKKKMVEQQNESQERDFGERQPGQATF